MASHQVRAVVVKRDEAPESEAVGPKISSFRIRSFLYSGAKNVTFELNVYINVKFVKVLFSKFNQKLRKTYCWATVLTITSFFWEGFQKTFTVQNPSVKSVGQNPPFQLTVPRPDITWPATYDFEHAPTRYGRHSPCIKESFWSKVMDHDRLVVEKKKFRFSGRFSGFCSNQRF